MVRTPCLRNFQGSVVLWCQKYKLSISDFKNAVICVKIRRSGYSMLDIHSAFGLQYNHSIERKNLVHRGATFFCTTGASIPAS